MSFFVGQISELGPQLMLLTIDKPKKTGVNTKVSCCFILGYVFYIKFVKPSWYNVFYMFVLQGLFSGTVLRKPRG